MITVIVASYGSDEWRDLAMSRAFPSAMEQAPTVAVHHPDGTLATARNAGASDARTPWLCFLDADDEIDPGYIAAMRVTILDAMSGFIGVGDEGLLHRRTRMFTPRVQYMRAPDRPEGSPMFHREVPIERGSWMVIGTVVSNDLFHHVGGFEEWPKYEEWALHARMQKAGAKVVRVPDAIYRAFRHKQGEGRNREGGRPASLAAHEMIHRAVFPELYPVER